MLSVFNQNKRGVHTSRHGLLGSRVHTVELGGRLFESKAHKRSGLCLQVSHYPSHLNPLSSAPHPLSSSSEVQHQSSVGGSLSKTHRSESKAATKKKLSSILRGGALAPL
jgi:hypothetical protein